MTPELSAACQMFITLMAILFVALAVATTEELRALLAAMVLGISILFFVRVWIGRELLLIADKYTSFGLALIFLVAALLSVFVHGRQWGRRHEAPPPQSQSLKFGHGPKLPSFGDIAGRLAVLRIERTRCDLMGNGPKRAAPQLHERCDLNCPDLPKAL